MMAAPKQRQSEKSDVDAWVRGDKLVSSWLWVANLSTIHDSDPTVSDTAWLPQLFLY